MIVIFLYSAKPADESREESLRAGYLIGQLFIPGFKEWNPDSQYAFAKKIDHPVRKCAHATEYAILAIFYWLTLMSSGRKRKGVKTEKMSPEAGMMRWAWFFATLYASSDEFHQLFVPGRSGQITDVMIDSSGAMAGLFASYLLIMLWKKLRWKQKSVRK